MSHDRYTGQIGPADAMSALEPAFHEAYGDAVAKIMNAVREFERVTGRVVDNVELQRIDVTRLASVGKEFIRQASLDFLPNPNEVEW